MDAGHRLRIVPVENDGQAFRIWLEGANDQAIAHLVRSENIEGRAVVATDNGVYRPLV